MSTTYNDSLPQATYPVHPDHEVEARNWLGDEWGVGWDNSPMERDRALLRQYLTGIEKFDTGLPLESCSNDEQSKGWNAAWDAVSLLPAPPDDLSDEPGWDYQPQFGPRFA